MSCFNFVFTFIVICLSYFNHNSICICSIIIIFCLGLKAHFCWVQFSPFQTSNSSGRKALQQAYRPMPSSPPGPFSLSYCLAQQGPSLARPNSHAPPAQQLAALPTDPAVPMASLAILPSPRCFEQAFPTRAVTILYPVCSLTPVTRHRQPPARQVPSHSLAPAHHQPSVFSPSARPSKARPSRPHSRPAFPHLHQGLHAYMHGLSFCLPHH